MDAQPPDSFGILKFDELARQQRLVHGITTKPWNMACHCGPDQEKVVGWRQDVCQRLRLPFERLTCAQQVHGGEIAHVDDEQAGAGRQGRSDSISGVDGLTTDRPGIGLMLLSADCPLILVFDPLRPALGLAHASWKGTVARISQRLVERMVALFASDPRELFAGIGPSAGPQRYVVGDEVRKAAAESLGNHGRYFRQTSSGMTFDLWSANRDLLQSTGVRPDRIEIAGQCTIGDERFFSWRREGPETGRFALVAGLTSP